MSSCPCFTAPVCVRARVCVCRCEGSKVEEAVSKARAGHYQIACACAFEGIHKTDMDVGINHPTGVCLCACVCMCVFRFILACTTFAVRHVLFSRIYAR